MVTSTIGNIFVKAYNEKFGTNYDAKGFFMEIFYPLFFDHPKYMMAPALNSPLQNSFNDPELGNVPVRGKEEKMIKGEIESETPEIRALRYRKLIKCINEKGAEASTAIGYSSMDVMATTSGQMTNMDIDVDDNSIFASWIGHGLGVGVEGCTHIKKQDKQFRSNIINFLFFDIRILLDIFDGWKYYRKSLNFNSFLKGNQINTWNARWLVHKYSRQYQKTNEMASFAPYSPHKNKIMQIEPAKWTDLLFSISFRYQDVQMMTYLYKVSKINVTYGFIPILLNEIRSPIDLYKKLFGQIYNKKSVEELYGTELGLVKSCQQGSIGLKALAPKDVKDFIYMKGDKKQIRVSEYEDENKIGLTYRTYQTWILAMLNNQELWDKSQEFAQVLHQYVLCKEDNTGTKRKNQVNEVLNATNKKVFITALTEIVKVSNQTKEFVSMAEVVNLMPMDNVPYFLALIRFNYASLNK